MSERTINEMLNSPLPDGYLPGPNLSPPSASKYVEDILKKMLPSSDSTNLKKDVRWAFILTDKKTELPKKRKRKTFLTREQRIELGLLVLPKTGWNYHALEPMRELWRNYMRENLDSLTAPKKTDPIYNSFCETAFKAELIGADLRVVQSKNPSQVGICGTLVLETKMTFQLVTPKSELKKELIELSHTKKLEELQVRKKVVVDSAFLHYFIRELNLSAFYRRQFLNYLTKNINGGHIKLVLILRPTKKDLIDYSWNSEIYRMVRERCELDHALSWLSTLGGAFSALGDYFANCAETAGKISVHQLKLAVHLNDPNIVSRCRLYFSLSLIQRKKFKLARSIIYSEFQQAKKAVIVDIRLIKMCHGIWSKLQYDYDIYRASKKKACKSSLDLTSKVL